MFGRIFRKSPDLVNVMIITYFMKIGLPRAAIYRVCQCIETRKTAERKAESGRGAVQMPEKKRNQLVKTIRDKKGVTSMKLAGKMNADRSFVDRIVREAVVKTYTRITPPELGQSWNRGKRWIVERTRAEMPILSPTGVEMDPLAVP